MFYQLQDGLRYSYTYGSDLNNDGLSGNDLIFVPENKSDIILVPENAGDTRTPDQLWAQLNSYISQDSYLNKRRGKYAERNGLVGNIIGTLDIRLAQDLFANVKNKKHSLQFTFDIFNFGNMINKTWGVPKISNRSNGLLNFKGVDAASGKPTFSFPYLNAENNVPLVNTFSSSIDETARWRIQLGLKYRFNQ